jgi:ubiquinone/menaquinone biosynthesis C-methylase UbiE
MRQKRIKELVKKQFGSQALCYATSKPHSNGDSLEAIVSWAKPRKNEILLDIATGLGFTAFAFAPYVDKIIALDITLEMINRAKALSSQRGITNVFFQIGEAETLPFKCNTFNIVTCRIAAHHFIDVRGFLSEVKRVLIPSGRFLLVDTYSPENNDIYKWRNYVEKLRDPPQVINYSPNIWKSMIEKSGMPVERINAQLHRTYLSFSDWTRTAGCSDMVKKELLTLFRSASKNIIDAFDIYEKNDDICFSWPLILIEARNR